MESATFRKWLAERGCRFDHHEQETRGEGHAVLTIHREGKSAKLSLVGSRDNLDPRAVRQVCEQLALDWRELPGPKSRV